MTAASDQGALSALVAYQQEVVFGYAVALAKAPLRDSDRHTLERSKAEAEQAAAVLRRELQAAGGKASAPPDPATAPPAADPTRAGFLRDLVAVEEASIQAYYRALQRLTGERHLRGSAAFMAQSGRRLVVLRDLAGMVVLPRNFETGGA